MDARKSLPMLRQEWVSCTRCELGKHRQEVDGAFVFGEGTPRGIMFIGEGPGKNEEDSGRPFVGKAGDILRKVINHLGLRNYYISNIVACRSCSPWTDAQGQPMLRRNFKTRAMEVSYKDEPPTPTQMTACMPRLHEEIYLVDPVLIVALGAIAAKALIGKPVAITSPEVRGQPVHISIPGAGLRTVRTEKRDAWIRRTRGVTSLPVEQNEVRYLCIPTLHPSYVGRKITDVGGDSPFQQFASDLRKAVQIYERYMLELYGTLPSGEAENPIDFDPGEQE